MFRRLNCVHIALAAFLAAGASSSGCMFRKVRKDEKVQKTLGEITGEVTVEAWSGAPVVVAAVRLPAPGENLVTIVDIATLREPQPFRLVANPGRYLVVAAEDTNGNTHLDAGERATLSSEFDVEASKPVPALTLSIDKPYTPPVAYKDLASDHDDRFSGGDVLPLLDQRFGPTIAALGVWEPIKYALENRPGIYMLEAYDPTKTPVLFVHGMGGYPQEFTKLIERLDKTRFQAWVALYPSGFRLDKIGNRLHLLLNELEAKHSPPQICVVAHSMGGLVARSMIKSHAAGTPDHRIRGFVTIASPLGGIPSAGMGVKMAPAVVPSWYDLDPHSTFLRDLYEARLPPEIEYHLLFAYDESGASDSVVPLRSQLRSEAQGEAEVVRGYLATHVGALVADAVGVQVLAALDRCSGKADAPRIAPRPEEKHVVKGVHEH